MKRSTLNCMGPSPFVATFAFALLFACSVMPIGTMNAQEPANEGAPPTVEAPADTSDDTPADAAPTGEAPANPAPVDAPTAEAADEPTAEAESVTTANEATDETTEAAPPTSDASDASTGDEPTTDEAVPATSESTAPAESSAADGKMSKAMLILLIVAIIALPVLIGNSAAKNLKLPDHGWKISLVIFTVFAGLAICLLGEFKLGPDLAGGVTLIYELEDDTLLVDENDPEAVAAAENAQGRKREPVTASKLVESLKMRVDPSGTKEVIIRPYGKAFEIIIPKAGGDELRQIKETITRLGALEFRITVDRSRSEQQEIIRLAEALPPGQTVVRLGGDEVAKWVGYKEAEFGTVDEGTRQGLVKRMGVNGPEALVLIDPYEVNGKYLTSTTKGTGNNGWEVQFRFDAQGASRFGRLTGSHLPTKASGREFFLGIILDNTLLSAPSINGRITTEGQISGNMTEKEVDDIVAVLEAGSLPASLNETPVSEEQISPTIGKQTIEQATFAMLISMAIVVVFMIFYYRFAGIVAVLALSLNVLLVLAVMVMIRAAFTLPGLAGLVLTVGMSVDANVLIFERIREELGRGAGLRMAIRNGFGKATTTIVDANVTTLIVGVVLFLIGTDTIKGFAVTLILGIIMSMYSAIFCSRLVFDIAERRNWLRTLKMSQIIGNPGINFIGLTVPAVAVSLVLIVVGLVGAIGRTNTLFDIDFTGGTSVTMALRDDQSMQFGDVRSMLKEPFKDKNLQVVERGTDGKSFTIDSSEQSVEEVQKILAKVFGDKLANYDLSISNVAPFNEGTINGTVAEFHFGNKGNDVTAVSHDMVDSRLVAALQAKEHVGIVPIVENPERKPGSSQRFNVWNVKLGLPPDEAQAVFNEVQTTVNSQPIFPLANKIGPRVAGKMKETAIYAIVVSLLGIVGYIWLRFQKISYGLAAVVALLHDILIALGLVAISAYIANGAEGLALLLKIDSFQISLTIVAAFLTIIGYSLNDTIVVFDRIREVRGKSPRLDAEMINTSINQTLSRTLLTSLTTLVVVAILFWSGGPGVHGFAFTLLVGIIVGTYSSIFIASPALLWLSRFEGSTASARGRSTSTNS